MRTYLHENVSSSKEKGPNARPLLSATIQHTIRKGRYSVHPPLKLLRIYQTSHISLSKIHFGVETRLPSRKDVTLFKHRLMRKNSIQSSAQLRHVYRENLRIMRQDIFKLRTSRQLQSTICLETQASLRQSC